MRGTAGKPHEVSPVDLRSAGDFVMPTQPRGLNHRRAAVSSRFLQGSVYAKPPRRLPLRGRRGRSRVDSVTPTWEPTCGASGCLAASLGILVVATPQGSARLSVCTRHGEWASQGKWFAFRSDEVRFVLGDGTAPRPAHFEPWSR